MLYFEVNPKKNGEIDKKTLCVPPFAFLCFLAAIGRAPPKENNSSSCIKNYMASLHSSTSKLKEQMARNTVQQQKRKQLTLQ